MRAGKRLYARLFAEVAGQVNQCDPLGLLASGAPSDEYAPQVGAVLVRLKEARGPEDVQRILHEVFVHFFGSSAGPESLYTSPAGGVWEAWGRFRDRGSATL